MSLERVRLGRVLRTDMSSERVRLGQQLLNERLPKRGTCCQHCIANSGEHRKDELPLFFPASLIARNVLHLSQVMPKLRIIMRLLIS